MGKLMKKISMISVIVINFIYSKVFAIVDPGLVIDPPRTPITIAEASGWWYVMKLYIIPIIFVVISVIFYKKNAGTALKKIITIIITAIVLCLICCGLESIIIQEKIIYMYI